ncbi:glycosyltransferase family 39 protein [Candidatus Gottesmanbacteria bacterium]|nr:glycosyltransferase family 39 protein [Candidatus Gottesmanbacteria bacterium]
MRTKIFLGLIVFFALALRLYRLGEVPLGLYWDEASLGYNAYSISQTLRDEHGEFLPLSRFIAFGDYKPPAYIYAAAITIKFFGLSEFSIRLPSALAGTFLVLVSYFLAKEFLNKKIALVAALLVAISPWSLQMSRAAFEANLATLFSGLGILLFLRSKYKTSALSFALAMYTFNSHRVFVPLMILFLLVILGWKKKNLWKGFIFFLLVFAVLLLPLAPHLLSREGSLRFQEVAWINDTSLIEQANKQIAGEGDSLVARLIHNRRVLFGQQFLKHYADHFRADFLFFTGDANPKLSLQTHGELYWLDLPLLLFGLYYLWRKKNRFSVILLGWLFLSPVPAAFARETPHALRILQVLPVPQIIAALGLIKILSFFRLKYLAVFLFFLPFFFYLHDYYLHYPKTFAMDWEYGYKEMVNYLREVENKYDYIQITGKYGRPYIYVLLYEKYPPEKYWQLRKVDRDWYGFWYVHSFDKYIFDDPVPPGKILYVRESEGTDPQAHILKSILNPKEEVVFNIYDFN